MFRSIDWSVVKRMTSLIAALGLMVVSIIGFNNGLQFTGEYGGFVTLALWISFTIIQFIGNDMENHDDWVFTALWVFTYMVGIGAGSVAIYNFIGIQNEFTRWIVSVGIAGSAEIAPERLIVMFLRSGIFQNVKIRSMPMQVDKVSRSMVSERGVQAQANQERRFINAPIKSFKGS